MDKMWRGKPPPKVRTYYIVTNKDLRDPEIRRFARKFSAPSVEVHICWAKVINESSTRFTEEDELWIANECRDQITADLRHTTVNYF